MGWVNKVEYVTPHTCQTPQTDNYLPAFDIGSRWSCDECGTLYEFTMWNILGTPHWEPKGKSLAWRIDRSESTAGTLTTRRRRWYNR